MSVEKLLIVCMVKHVQNSSFSADCKTYKLGSGVFIKFYVGHGGRAKINKRNKKCGSKKSTRKQDTRHLKWFEKST